VNSVNSSAEEARDVEPAKSASLGFARQLEGEAPAPRHADKVQRREAFRHRMAFPVG
jgi:hypothetical protein